MGYNLYWKQPYEIDRPTWGQISTDCRRLLGPLEDAGVVLADAWGQGEPLMNLEEISLNGAARCGHKRGLVKVLQRVGSDGLVEVRSVPLEDSWRLPSWEARSCSGSCDYETFKLSPDRGLGRLEFVQDQPASL